MLQADAYSDDNDLYLASRAPGPVRNALCWSHARRKFFELADIAGNLRKNKPAHDISPVAPEAVKRIDAIFDIEREINGLDAAARHAARQGRSRPLVEGLHSWLLEERARLSKHNSVAKAVDYLMPPKGVRWAALTAFLGHGRICLNNNAAERALRGIALRRKSWLFAGLERGGESAALMYTQIISCKMNDIDPQAWMAVSWRACRISSSHACLNCSHGTGKPTKKLSRPRNRVPRRMLTDCRWIPHCVA